MLADNYTKFVLTVIACSLLALIVLVARNATGRLSLHGHHYDKIQFCDSNGCMEVFNVTIDSCERKQADAGRP